MPCNFPLKNRNKTDDKPAQTLLITAAENQLFKRLLMDLHTFIEKLLSFSIVCGCWIEADRGK